MKSLFLSLIFILILTGSSLAQINTLSGWDGMNLSVLNDDLREMSSKSGIQKINTINDLSSAISLSVLNNNLATVGRQLSVPQVSALTGFDDVNLTVLNNDLEYINQTLGA